MIKYVVSDEELEPKFGSEGAAAIDLRIDRDVLLRPGKIEKVGTGVKVAVPEGYGLFILPRSGTKFELVNTIGLIDPDYRGEIFVKMRLNPEEEAEFYQRGDRIVQAVLVETSKLKWTKVSSLDETARGEKGFGSTGKE